MACILPTHEQKYENLCSQGGLLYTMENVMTTVYPPLHITSMQHLLKQGGLPDMVCERCFQFWSLSNCNANKPHCDFKIQW